MNRRALMATTAALAVAGCTDAVGSLGTDNTAASETEKRSDTDTNVTTQHVDVAADPTLTETTLVEAGAAVEDAAVSFEPDTVHVSGTVTGKTGCHSATIDDATVNDDGTFHLVIGTTDDTTPDQLCTQALTEIGYELDATFDDGVPQTVTVVHDDAHGPETVEIEHVDE